jgi:hypothetical protein
MPETAFASCVENICSDRVARFFWHTKNGKNIPNEPKIYQITMKYTKWPQNRPKGQKIYQHFPFQDHRKFTRNLDFGLKINHLATLCSDSIIFFLYFDLKGRKTACITYISVLWLEKKQSSIELVPFEDFFQ